MSSASAGAGEPCGLEVTGSTSEVTWCESGLWCKAPSGERQGTCVAPVAAGAACETEDDVCEDGSVCVEDTSGISCTAVTVRAAGESCGGLEVCNPATGYCSGGECAALGDGTEGSTCLTFSCQPGLYCDIPQGETTGLCAARLDNEEPCQTGRDCVSGKCEQSGAVSICIPAFCSP